MIDRVGEILLALLALFVMLALSLAGEIGKERGTGAGAATPSERRLARDARISLLLSLSGIAVCLGGLFWANPILAGLAIFVFVFAFASRVAVLLEADPAAWLGRFVGPRPTRKQTLFWSGAIAAVALLVVLLIVPSIGGTSESAGPERGPYEVSGTTCGDGSCTLNECRETEPCGLHNVGRLPAGRKLAIECQLKGGKVKTPDGRHFSFIWDRVAPHVFVSDLFIDGTRFNRFTAALPRCSARD